MDAGEIIRSALAERGIRRLEGELSVVEVERGESKRILSLFRWENPFLIGGLISPDKGVRGYRFRLEGKGFTLLSARAIGDEDSLDALELTAIDELGAEHRILWRGRGILMFTEFRPGLRRIELVSFYKLPFRKAVELARSGYPVMGGEYVAYQSDLYALPEELKRLPPALYEKIAHPFRMATQSPEKILSGIQEVVDPTIAATRVATFVLTIIARTEELCERLLGFRLSEIEDGENILETIASDFWIAEPVLRTDPLLPDRGSFGRLVKDVWNSVKDTVAPKERLSKALSVISSELDFSQLAVEVAKRMSSAGKI